MNSDSQTYEFTFDEDQLLANQCIESLLRGDCVLDDMDELSFVCGDFPLDNSCDLLDDYSIHSASSENSSLTGSEVESFSDDDTTIQNGAIDTCRAVSPDSSVTSTKNSLVKLNECMERSALSRSLVEQYCKSNLIGKLIRRSSLKNSVAKRRRSSILVSRSVQSTLQLPRNVSHDSSIGSFLRNKKTRSVTASPIKSGNFQASGLKYSTKLDGLTRKVTPFRSDATLSLPKPQTSIASFLRRRQIDTSVRYGTHSCIEEALQC
jgi:hypothetical protein